MKISNKSLIFDMKTGWIRSRSRQIGTNILGMHYLDIHYLLTPSFYSFFLSIQDRFQKRKAYKEQRETYIWSIVEGRHLV